MRFLRFFISVLLVIIILLALSVNKRNIQIASQTRPMPYPLSIEAMSQKNYPGSEMKIEEVVEVGEKYSSYIASYKSNELLVYGLLMIPIGESPESGWPAIIFNHGYIPPEIYQTTERYIDYVSAFANNGYIVFKPDFRGHGNSKGIPENPYYSEAYSEDVLNAISSIKRLKDPKDSNKLIVNSAKIGMWGHSMGGNITLRSLVVAKDIKAAVIWAGVVGSYDEILNKWNSPVKEPPSKRTKSNKDFMLNKYGNPTTNPIFWNSIDPTQHLKDIITPIQLHHTQADSEVPLLFSISLKNRLLKEGKTVQLYVYSNGDHNIGPPNFDLAMSRSIAFFDKYLK